MLLKYFNNNTDIIMLYSYKEHNFDLPLRSCIWYTAASGSIA